MTDDEIKSLLQGVGAAWLMDSDDACSQVHALRYLVHAVVAAERERCANVINNMRSETGWIGKTEAERKIREA